jgi:hypothetical protein
MRATDAERWLETTQRDGGYDTYAVADFLFFHGFPETLPLDELAIGIRESWWFIRELVGGV